MSLEKLKHDLDILVQKLIQSDNIWNEVESLTSAFPFNDYEYVISHLLSYNIIQISDYKRLRSEYISRSVYLPLFEFAPRTFGERWGQGHIKSISEDFLIPTKDLDADFDGEYDLILPCKKKYIKIEVKSSRATDTSTDKKQLPPVTKALTKKTELNFDMNFQQLKHKCCDVFIFIIVWVDEIDLYVLNWIDLINNRYYNGAQHRGNIDEGQLHIKPNNIREFDKFLVKPRLLTKIIIESYKKIL
jgi:hypothetical protein